jgi:hypothetical protein
VAEYSFDRAESLPLWTLPETTDVLVTDQRVRFTYADGDASQARFGEVRWHWPQHLRVQPGARSTDRGAAASQIQLVCAGADGSWPALVLAGGDLASVPEADHLANTIRQAIARFRVDHADKLGLTTPQSRMLSRLLMGPEFRNHQGGDGQTVSLLGALPVHRPAASPLPVHPPAAPAASDEMPDRAVAEGTRQIKYRPGLAADAVRAMMAAEAELKAQQAEPDRASRAAELAARVADLVSRSAVPHPRPAAYPDAPQEPPPTARAGPPPPSTPPPSTPPPSTPPPAAPQPAASPEPPVAQPEQVRNMPTINLAERAKAVRRMAARMAANAARNRTPVRRADRGSGIGSHGRHRG